MKRLSAPSAPNADSVVRSQSKHCRLCINMSEVRRQKEMAPCCRDVQLRLSLSGICSHIVAPASAGVSSPHLVSCGHDGHHRELLDLHLCDAHGGQQADLRRAHVGALRKHTLPTLDVMTDGPVMDKTTANDGGESEEKATVSALSLNQFFSS